MQLSLSSQVPQAVPHNDPQAHPATSQVSVHSAASTHWYAALQTEFSSSHSHVPPQPSSPQVVPEQDRVQAAWVLFPVPPDLPNRSPVSSLQPKVKTSQAMGNAKPAIRTIVFSI
jgi:hypothetical protein